MFIRDYLSKFEYYAKPEGQDPIGKIVGFGKYGLLASTGLTLTDALTYSRCANMAQFLNCAGYWFIPITGMTIGFTSTVYILNNIRKKDDKYNYCAGVFTSSYIFNRWQKCISKTGVFTFFMLVYAIIKKDTMYYNRKKNVFIPNEYDPSRMVLSWRNDENRNYLSKPKYTHVKDYYVNFDYKPNF